MPDTVSPINMVAEVNRACITLLYLIVSLAVTYKLLSSRIALVNLTPDPNDCIVLAGLYAHV